MQPLEKNYKRIVVKVGSSILRSKENKLDSSFIAGLAEQVSCLVKNKKEVVLVSSGAILLGMSALGLESRPRGLSCLQAVAAIGQNELMNAYRQSLDRKGLVCGQVLLTWEDFADRRRYLNAKNTLVTLLKLGSIPIINENDTVATDEIKFGDNDRLSALVSSLISADLLIILSDVPGLLNKDQKTVIKLVKEITPAVFGLARSTDKKTSVGGMITKIEAAKIAVNAGIPCVIANGKQKDILLSLAEKPYLEGTLFLPRKVCLTEKKRWIAFGTKPKGKITVDEGAKKALLNNKSLLCVGIIDSGGNFQAGDIVSVTDKQANEFARGKTTVSGKHLQEIKGRRYSKEIIHRDNIVIL